MKLDGMGEGEKGDRKRVRLKGKLGLDNDNMKREG